MMRQLQKAPRALETKHPQTQVCEGDTWHTLTWILPLEIASLADTDEVSIWTACKKYRKRVRASCKLSKDSDRSETQMKRIRDSHQHIWGHDHKIIKAKWKHVLADDHTSFEIRRMVTRIDQLLHIAEATGSKIFTRESEAEAQVLAKALVLSFEQFHAHYYRLYEKGTTRAMVGHQGLHSSDAFWHLNVSASMDLKSFFPCCF